MCKQLPNIVFPIWFSSRIEQRIFVVTEYFQSGSLNQVRTLFRQRFPDREPPTATNICMNVNKYTATGTSLNRNPVASGRPRYGRSEDDIDRVQELLRNNPRGISCRRDGLGLPLPIFYLFKILNRPPSPTQMSVLSKLGKTCPLY